MGPHHYHRLDLTFETAAREAIIKRVAQNRPVTLDGTEVLKYDDRDGFRYLMADGSWLLIRFSGTEPVLRIYAETQTEARVKTLLALGRDIVGLS